MNTTTVTLDKTIYVGLSVLDISKIVMYKFYYDFMKKHVPNDKLKVLYMDTDSFIIELKNHDIYLLVKENFNEFDTSNYPMDNRWRIPRVNKKIPVFLFSLII